MLLLRRDKDCRVVALNIRVLDIRRPNSDIIVVQEDVDIECNDELQSI